MFTFIREGYSLCQVLLCVRRVNKLVLAVDHALVVRQANDPSREVWWAHCHDHSDPPSPNEVQWNLIICHWNGMLGYVRVQLLHDCFLDMYKELPEFVEEKCHFIPLSFGKSGPSIGIIAGAPQVPQEVPVLGTILQDLCSRVVHHHQAYVRHVCQWREGKRRRGTAWAHHTHYSSAPGVVQSILHEGGNGQLPTLTPALPLDDFQLVVG